MTDTARRDDPGAPVIPLHAADGPVVPRSGPLCGVPDRRAERGWVLADITCPACLAALRALPVIPAWMTGDGPVPGADLLRDGGRVRRAAEVLMRDYESQYSLGNNTWRDFAELARDVLEAADGAPPAGGEQQ